jgi:protein gp37
MRDCPQHHFQLLTKRAERLAELAPRLDWVPNVWMGVSIENADYAWRAGLLEQVPAAVRFLSVEPMLGPIERLPLAGIHWVIVGGESGYRAREMKADWARSIRDQCRDAGVAFFFKQWGGVRRKLAGRQLDEREWNEMPVVYDLDRLRRESSAVSSAKRAQALAAPLEAQTPDYRVRRASGIRT